jgi:release factor glutamine methyltransferase
MPTLGRDLTLGDAVAGAARRLADAGRDEAEARREAALLARWRLGWDPATWLQRQRDGAPEGFDAALEALVARRARHEPMAYITGEREFFGRPFGVTPAVLIPRPETELVVDEALQWLRTDAATASPLIVDAGTGSGCLAITLALEWPSARVVAVDRSAEALAVARENAERLGAPVRFVHGSWLEGETGVDLIVSNPPYVAERDRDALAPDVVEYEPAAALFAGPDGLDAIRALVPAAARALAPGGALLMEIGAGQNRAVADLVASSPPLAVVRIAADLQSIPRVVIAHVPLLPHHRR